MDISELKILAQNTAGEYERDFIGEIFTVMDGIAEPKIIELGTGYGSFLLPLAISCKEKNGKVFTIDKRIQTEIGYDTVKEKIKRYELDDFVHFIISDDLDEALVDGFSNDSFDIVMIDTSHTYLHTLMELVCYNEKLKKGGYFILHDTGKQTGYGVRKAVETFIKHFDYLIIKDIGKGAGLMILKKW